MHITRVLLSISVFVVLAILPVIESVNRRAGVELDDKEPQGSLRGVLRALERRRRTPSASYPLASFQDHEDPQDIMEYLESRNDYQNDPNGRPVGKALLLNYLDKEEYPLDDADPIYKNTVFRERNDQLKDHYKPAISKKSSSAFRERETKQNYQPDDLQDLFLKNLVEREEEEQREESDAEYAELLRRLWEKYKYTHPESYYNEQRELLGPFKERNIRKRQIPGDYIPSGGWGPIAFKKKRSSKQRIDNNDNPDFLYSLKFVSQDPAAVENLKDDKIVDEEEDPDISKIININGPDSRYSPYDMPISQPLDLDEDPKLTLQPLNYPSGDEVFLPDGSEIIESPVGSENLYPITKRSNGLSAHAMYNQRFAKRNLQNKSKLFRSSVTDPRVMKDLSSIFGISEISSGGENTIQKPVKRSNAPDDNSHESKSPTASARSHHLSNDSHESVHNDSSHEDEHDHDHDHGHSDHEHPHSRHEHENKPPLLVNSNNGFEHSHEGNEKEVEFDDTEETHIKLEHPIIMKKKSIDWSKYFGIDKRKKKSLNLSGRDYVEKAKRFMSSYSLQNFRNHDQKDNEEENAFEEKRKTKQIDKLKLDSMDNKLKNMETAMVDEALEYEGGNDGLDTKEEQEMKEKILSRLAAAYSLDKMRKALKDFKLSLQAQKVSMKDAPHTEANEDKEKRKDVPLNNNIKHELDTEDIKALEDNLFENEQGAGHFLNGPVEVMSEGYMGGNGLTNKGLHIDNLDGACPILDRIVRKCHNIDILAGDHGQLFLPLCSLHQVCYLCGPSSPTGCDLMFLSEADSACGGRAACQRAARGALMALRDLHAPVAHHLQGECSRDTCLARPLQDNKPWHQPFRR